MTLPEADDPASIDTAQQARSRTHALVQALMGRRHDVRSDYIQKNARFAPDLDV